VLINILIKPFYIFFIDTKVQNTVGDEAFGLYTALFSFVFLHQFINDPGIQSYNSVYVAQNTNLINHHFPRLIGLKLFLFPITLSIVLLSALVVGYDLNLFYIITSIVTLLFLSGMFVLLRSILSSLGQYRYDTWLSAVDRLILSLFLIGVFITGIKFQIQFFIITQIIVFGACIFIVLFFLYKKSIPILPIIDFKYGKQFLISCLPYTLIIFLTAIIMRADVFIIQRLLVDGNFQAGIYQKGYRFLDAANMFGNLFGALLLPMYANKMAEKSEIKGLFSLALKTLWLLCITIGFSFYFYKTEVFSLIYDNVSSTQLNSLSPLLYTIIPVAMTNIFGPLIIAAKKIRAYNLVFICVVVLYLIANYIFIPKNGIYASSIICFLSWTFVLIGMIFICIKNKLIHVDLKVLNQIFILLMIAFIAFKMINQLTIIYIPWPLKIIISIIVTIGVPMLLKIIDYKDIIEKQKEK
jgi:O-antigen/teichoic acid export membrane protein